MYPTYLSFGYVEAGQSAERRFTVWNQGSEDLHLEISLDCPEYLVLEGGGERTVTAGDSIQVRLEYRPTTRQNSQCTVTLGEGACWDVGCVGNPFRRWYIRADGTGDAPTIQAAIDSSKDGDEITVGPGTYYENLDFLGNDIVLRSETGPEQTILDGSRRDSSVVVIRRGETRAAVLEGFTITGGRGSKIGTPRGGGIYSFNSSPTIRGNRIVGNRCGTYGLGGGMISGTYGDGVPLVSPLIEGNLFEANESGQNGGGLALTGGVFEVRGNVFRGNRCVADGGGIWVWMRYGQVVIEHNEFLDNVAGDHGGGVYAAQTWIEAEPYTIERNLFVRNQTTGVGHIGDTGSGGAIAALQMTGVIRYNTLVRNDGHHLTPCGGGGLLLYLTGEGLSVYGNLIAFNDECGIACWWEGTTAAMGRNLVWGNGGGDLGTGWGTWGSCPGSWADALLFADPLFCDPENDDYAVASNSPALTGEEVMGVYSEPGCGRSEPVPAGAWDRLRALFPN